MRTISLSQGRMAIVDDAEYEWISRWKWYVRKARRTFYAVRNERLSNGKQRTIRMHREILELSHGDGIQCDHKNGNGLDNRKQNLRNASRAGNMHNSRMQTNNTSGYTGVYQLKDMSRWVAKIGVNGTLIHLGTYDDPADAARARDVAALAHHGEFARLNFPARIQ